MLKFLLYLFLIYFVVRFLFGRVFGPVIKTKVFHYHAAPHKETTPEENKEGTITIQQTESGKAKNDKSLGDYVDYEEVK